MCIYTCDHLKGVSITGLFVGIRVKIRARLAVVFATIAPERRWEGFTCLSAGDRIPYFLKKQKKQKNKKQNKKKKRTNKQLTCPARPCAEALVALLGFQTAHVWCVETRVLKKLTITIKKYVYSFSKEITEAQDPHDCAKAFA